MTIVSLDSCVAEYVRRKSAALDHDYIWQLPNRSRSRDAGGAHLGEGDLLSGRFGHAPIKAHTAAADDHPIKPPSPAARKPAQKRLDICSRNVLFP
jgi:hypothetical protein